MKNNLHSNSIMSTKVSAPIRLRAMVGLTVFVMSSSLVASSTSGLAEGSNKSSSLDQASDSTIPYTDFNLQGLGSYRWWGIKIYDAKLYARSPVNENSHSYPQVIFELTYDISIKSRALVSATMDEWEDIQVGRSPQCEGKVQWEKQMQSLWPNLKQGDRLTLYIDEREVSQFSFNGNPLGIIDDKKFGYCFLSIWLANDTNASDLRKKLLQVK